jgi:hypothetical protein
MGQFEGELEGADLVFSGDGLDRLSVELVVMKELPSCAVDSVVEPSRENTILAVTGPIRIETDLVLGGQGDRSLKACKDLSATALPVVRAVRYRILPMLSSPSAFSAGNSTAMVFPIPVGA